MDIMLDYPVGSHVVTGNLIREAGDQNNRITVRPNKPNVGVWSRLRA